MQDFADLAATRLRDLNEPLYPPQHRPGVQQEAGDAHAGAPSGGKYTAEELAKARAYALSIVEEFERTGAIAPSVVQSARHWQREWWRAAVVPALLAVGSEGESVKAADDEDPTVSAQRAQAWAPLCEAYP